VSCRKLLPLLLRPDSSDFQALLARGQAPVHVARYFNFLSAQPKFASVMGVWNVVEKVSAAVQVCSSTVGVVATDCIVLDGSFFSVRTIMHEPLHLVR